MRQGMPGGIRRAMAAIGQKRTLAGTFEAQWNGFAQRGNEFALLWQSPSQHTESI